MCMCWWNKRELKQYAWYNNKNKYAHSYTNIFNGVACNPYTNSHFNSMETSNPILWNNGNNSHPYLGDMLAHISLTSNCHKQNFISWKISPLYTDKNEGPKHKLNPKNHYTVPHPDLDVWNACIHCCLTIWNVAAIENFTFATQ